ncbi:dnaJ homolog subfamily C member 1-like isoform X2 [Acipenser ruthenus]|uniref:dnaJ homolog subfamily C member 1-like isoform X2 n=1 Tax=Acipenser ruthenus TaxID=7906 RepID=UPI00145A5C13|nr:dnaJ homolog subfamily C member 1-like isoform X2 [Acipenser ruthenus]
MAFTGPAFLAVLLIFITNPLPSFTWDTDLELFDLVEEIQQNFYEFLAVAQDASSADIRKAYRKLSLTLHPDKNKDENAETQFRQLVAIYEVLKDEERRQRYNDILVNGLPDWRQPVFYYRRVRKMSNAELGLLLFIILTVGHYAVIWSIYLEKQLDELLSRKKREKRKKTGNKGADDVKAGAQEKNERSSDKPQWHDILPFKLGIWLYFSVKSLPQLIQDVKQYYEDYKELKIKEKEAAQAQAEQEAIQKEKRPKVKKAKSEFPVYTAYSGDNAFVPSYDQGSTIEDIEEQINDWLEDKSRSQKKKALEWTEEDLSQLTRSMVKFPGGTPGRWEKIAHDLGRSVADVTSKVKQLKDCVASTSGTVRFSELKSTAQTTKGFKGGAAGLPDDIITKREEEEEEIDNPAQDPVTRRDTGGNQTDVAGTEIRHRKRKAAKAPEITVVIKDDSEEKQKGRRQRDFDSKALDDDSSEEKKGKDGGEPVEEVWTQNQQKLLELALQQYPKGTAERWDKIAKCVPGKSKEESMMRYKLLAELVQKRKQATS